MWTLGSEDYQIKQVNPQQLDVLLEHGFRHFGTHFYRYAAIGGPDGIKRILPVRIHLENFKPSRRHVRTLAAAQSFEIMTTAAFVNDGVLALFDRHKRKFTSNVPPSIYAFVSQEPATVPCECVCICIYDQERLIGISYLDISELSCSSVYQFYDLDYKRFGLGILMILKCLEFCQNTGKTFYYLGYATVEPSAYDYKKQFAGLECYDWQGRWNTWR